MTVIVVGSCNLDLVVEVPVLPTPGETVLGADVLSRPGGKGANQAVAAHRLGARTGLIAAVGTDHFADTLRAALSDAGVDLAGLVTVDGPSGIAVVVVEPGGENLITVASGANRRLAPKHLAGLERLTRDDVLLMQLETPVTTSLAAARIARSAGARVVLNAAPVVDDLQLAELLRLTDVLVVNEVEAQALGADDPLTLRDLGPDVAIVTRGPAGAVVADADGVVAVPAYPVTAVDSTGAGDAFCAALTVALAQHRPLSDAVRYGCLAGALATTALGAQAALPTAQDMARAGG